MYCHSGQGNRSEDSNTHHLQPPHAVASAHELFIVCIRSAYLEDRNRTAIVFRFTAVVRPLAPRAVIWFFYDVRKVEPTAHKGGELRKHSGDKSVRAPFPSRLRRESWPNVQGRS